MGDDIEINVTETTNIIEITPQPNDQIVDIAVTDNAPNVEINVTPSVVEINVTRGSSTAIWGSIEGNLTDQSDLVTALGLKADLIDGKVPSTQLPSYVDDVIEVANYAALPTTGETGKIYVTLDNNKIYRWSGSLYIEIAANQAIWGAITGNLGDQLDLQNALNTKEPTITAGTTSQYWRGDKSWQTLDKNAVGLGNVDNTSDLNKPISTATQTALDLKQNIITLTTSGTTGAATLVGSTLNIPNYTTDISGLVPYTGATGNVDLGTHKLTAADLVINHASGSGVAASITKGGNGEALTVVKSSGTGNAASITGGTTLLSELHLTTSLADAYISSAATWNAKQNALNGTGFVKISGTTISYDNSTYVPTARTLTINGTAYDLSANRSWTITAGVWGQITGTLSDQTDLQTALDAKTPTARTLTINGTAYDLSANRSWTIPTHDAVTIGTANGLSLSTQVLSLGLSSASANGALSSTDWTTFNNKQGALTFTSPLVNTSGTVSIPAATGSVNGYLTSTDWTTFNNKENAITAGTTLQYYRGDKTFQTLNTSVVPELTNLYYTEARVNANTNVAANTAARHNAVTIGTANGLSLSTQALSLALASTSTTGALSSTDWNTFNSKQGALNGTGFVKISGTTISYDNSTYALDSVVVKLSGSQTIADTKTFSGTPNFDNNIYLKKTGSWANPANYSVIGGMTHGFFLSSAANKHAYLDLYQLTQAQQFSFPNQSGTFAMTSDIPTVSGDTNYIPKFTGSTSLGNSTLQEVSGNLGLGVTPSASNTPTIEVGYVGNSLVGRYGILNLALNAYRTSSWKYANTGAVSNFELYNGGFDWYNAPSGTAGSDISFSLKMRLDSSGNLGIGVVPSSSWATGFRALQMTSGTALLSHPTVPVTYLGANYLAADSGAKYIQSDGAARFLVNGYSSNFSWDIAPAGTAGNAITFTTAMTLASTGNLLIGTTTDSGDKLKIQTSGAAINGLNIYSPSSVNGAKITLSDNIYGGFIKTVPNSSIGETLLVLGAGGTDAINIKQNGNVGIGTSSPSANLEVAAPNSVGQFAKFRLNSQYYNYWDFINNGDLSFSRGGSEKMRINESGNVGIGTTSPMTKLTVNNGVVRTNTTPTYSSYIHTNDTDDFRFGLATILKGGATGADRYVALESSAYQVSTAAYTGGLNLILNPNGGNVGIGTTSPGASLDVAGNIHIRSNNILGLFNADNTNNFQIYNGGSTGSGEANLIFTQSSVGERMRITSDGAVLLGTYSQTNDKILDFRTSTNVFTISTSATAATGTILSYGYASGSQAPLKFSSQGSVVMTLTASSTVNITSLGTGTVYSNGGTLTNTNPSDSRLKDNITDLQYGLNEILKLRPVSYNWKNDNTNQGKQFGFIAQEVQEVMPELVKEFETEDGEKLGLDKEGIYATLVNAIKELKAEIEILKNK